jgi:hypothetical protein
MWKLLQTFAFIAAGFVCLCFPFQLAFHGPVCIQGERRIWAWLYMACDVPLWLVSFALCLRALQDALRHRGPACIETLLRLIFNVLSLLCCLPWDGIAQISRNGAMQTGNYCFSYGHLSRCFFATRVITVLTRAITPSSRSIGMRAWYAGPTRAQRELSHHLNSWLEHTTNTPIAPCLAVSLYASRSSTSHPS